MDSEIEFGQVEQSQPQPGLRPDQDKHFVVAEVGQLKADDLPIFVDMDVLRDMESHARENTRVELGGVMLGRQHLDDEGQPFVVISDSLRAKHYEATKGSFKFTHETWSQITRERNEYRSDLEMVGWYHTHPGWGVFLSGMDLFICNNFFSRPLDVALVVEPCAGERGWFQWEDGQTRQTRGFFLITNRHRSKELNYFSDIFNNQNPTIADPRFRQASFDGSDQIEGDTMVNLVDNRRPVFELAIVSMLFLQLLMAGIFGYRLLFEFEDSQSNEMADRIVLLETRIAADQAARATSIREQAYANILDQIVAGETGQAGLVEKYANVAERNNLLVENVEGQRSQIAQIKNHNDELNFSLASEQKKAERLESELRSAQDSILLVRQENDELRSSDPSNGDAADTANSLLPPWVLYALAGTGLLVGGAIGGALIVRRSPNGYDSDEQWGNDDVVMAEKDSDGSVANRDVAGEKTVAG